METSPRPGSSRSAPHADGGEGPLVPGPLRGAAGQRVVDGEVGAAELFATIYRALGINHQKNYYVGPRPVPLTEPGTQPIKDVLA